LLVVRQVWNNPLLRLQPLRVLLRLLPLQHPVLDPLRR
jgi:hypothetical protein